MAVQHYAAIHPVDVEIFHSISENFDLLVALDQKSGCHNVIRTHRPGNMDVLYNISWQSIQTLVDQLTDRLPSVELCHEHR